MLYRPRKLRATCAGSTAAAGSTGLHLSWLGRSCSRCLAHLLKRTPVLPNRLFHHRVLVLLYEYDKRIAPLHPIRQDAHPQF